MKAVVAAFNQEKALVGAFSVLANLRMELFQALVVTVPWCLHLTHRRHCYTEQLIIAAQQTLQQRAGTLEAEDRTQS